tara:strand:+ start:1527 stop:2267 length:741 start_codon:yes stop_codon:yes gene_type:complete
MAEDFMYYQMTNVEALYPKLDTTYKFDNRANGGKGGSVRCDALDDGAEYSLSFLMTEAEAKELYKAMKNAYKRKKDDSWPDKFSLPFKKQEDGRFLGKAKLKGAYGTDKTTPPLQVDAKNNKLPADFQLTSGSIVNLAFTFVPYSVQGTGVSLRLNGVQVIDLKPMQSRSPFGVVDGGFVAQPDNPFSDTTKSTDVELDDDDSDDIFNSVEEEAPAPKEPKKVVKKSAPAPTDDDDVSALIEEWDD